MTAAVTVPADSDLDLDDPARAAKILCDQARLKNTLSSAQAALRLKKLREALDGKWTVKTLAAYLDRSTSRLYVLLKNG